jgi:hypothetical protein
MWRLSSKGLKICRENQGMGEEQPEEGRAWLLGGHRASSQSTRLGSVLFAFSVLRFIE